MSAVPIHLPRQFDGYGMAKVVNQLTRSAQTGLPDALSFDFSNLHFIKPTGTVFLSNLIRWLENVKGCTVTFNGLKLSRGAIRFLDDSLFFKQHLGHLLDPLASPRPTTSPLQHITHAESHSWLEFNMLPWLSNRLDLNVASLAAFKTCLSELFNNIVDHTRHDIGCIFSQHFPNGVFPNGNCLETALADFGVGIPETVRRVRPGLTDSDAILLAVEDGFTSRSLPTNRGAGLNYLLRIATVQNGGYVTIFSGNAIVKFSRAEDGSVRSFVRDDAVFCPGTVIEIKLRRDGFDVIEGDEEDLEW